jgi:hypothetical protein
MPGAATSDDALRFLREFPDDQRLAMSSRRTMLTDRTPRQRAVQIDGYWRELHDNLATHPPR